MRLTTQQVGKLGELLVQYKLLQQGVESAHMTTDSGIDLVAYFSKSKKAATIQVKANLKPKPSGGKGALALDWWVPEDSPADIFAFADVSESRVWLVTREELTHLAQQKSNGRLHFYMYTDPGVKLKSGKVAHAPKFDKFLLENRTANIF